MAARHLELTYPIKLWVRRPLTRAEHVEALAQGMP